MNLKCYTFNAFPGCLTAYLICEMEKGDALNPDTQI